MPLIYSGLVLFLAVRTGLEPATPGVTGRYSNQTELPHQKRCKINSIFHSSKYFINNISRTRKPWLVIV